MEDFDNECGFWLYNRPYVWIQGKTAKTCRRLYILYYNDLVHVEYLKGFGKQRAGDMNVRRIKFSSYKYSPLPDGKPDYSTVNILDLWGNKESKKACGWASRYFGVYIPQRDGKLKDLDVRRNGKSFKLNTNYLVDYLKISGIVGGRGVDFIKLPLWLKQE